MAEWITAIGTLLAGFAAVGAVVAASVQASRELRKRREEREADRDEQRRVKRAEVAADLAVAAQRFLIAIDMIASPEGLDTPRELSTVAGRKLVGEKINGRWDDAGQASNGFVEAWNVAKIYLPDEVDALCAEIWKFRTSVWSNQRTLLAMFGSSGGMLMPFWERALGPKVHTRAEELRVNALHILRPYAQLHPSAEGSPKRTRLVREPGVLDDGGPFPKEPEPVAPARPPFPFKPGEPLAIEPNALLAMMEGASRPDVRVDTESVDLPDDSEPEPSAAKRKA